MALNRIQEIILIVVVIIVSIMFMSYLTYNYTGWKSFTMKKGENFQITDADPKLVSKLQFRNCIFTIKGSDGTTKTLNVASILNTMAAAYEGNDNPGYVFKLDDPGLSTYSFRIPGFNDDKNRPDASIWGDEVAGTEATMIGNYKLLN